MFNYYDVEVLAFERRRTMELNAMRAELLAAATLSQRSPWRERLAVALIGLAGQIAPASAPAPVGEARLAHLRQS